MSKANTAPQSTVSRLSFSKSPLLHDWLHAFGRPGLLFQALLDLLASWFWTRNWMRLGLFAVVLVLTIGLALGTISRGALLSRESLISFYANLAEQETSKHRELTQSKQEADSSAAEASKTLIRDESTSSYGSMLYRRLMQLSDDSSVTRYMVATQLARDGKLSQAKQLMSEIAPRASRGFVPAHAWLAAQLLSRGKKLDASTQAELLDHLKYAVAWEGAGAPLRAVYASLLEQTGKPLEAVRELSQAAKQDQNLQIPLTAMAMRHGMTKVVEEAGGAAEQELEKRISSQNAKETDFIALANLWLIRDEPDRALELITNALKTQENSPQLKRVLSEILRMKFRKSLVRKGTEVSMNLELLDAALKADPTNPALGDEIAMILGMGQQVTADQNAMLHQQLVDGRASALMHLVFANQKLIAKSTKEAIPHLEVALKLAPRSPTIMNNLALALAKELPDQLERAESMIAEALAISGPVAAYLDTQGEIFLLSKKPLDAVPSLERAIQLAPTNIETRKLLAEAYRAAGLQDLAKAQEDFIAQQSGSKKD